MSWREGSCDEMVLVGWALNPVTGVLIRSRDTETQRHRVTRDLEGGGGQRQAKEHGGLSAATLGLEDRASRGKEPHRRLGFELLAF